MAGTAIANKKRASKGIPRVLVVDDEPELVQMLRDVIGRKIDCKILSAADIDEAKKIIAKEPVELLVTDLHLPGGDGMSLARNELCEGAWGAALVCVRPASGRVCPAGRRI